MRRRFVLAAVLSLISSLTLGAQTPRPQLAPGNTVLIAQYECAADQLSRADALMNEVSGPILNKYVSSGKIISWGYFGTYVGTKANRTIYVWANDPVALMQARATYLPEIMAHPKFPEFVKMCGAANISLHNMITMSSATAATK